MALRNLRTGHSPEKWWGMARIPALLLLALSGFAYSACSDDSPDPFIR